MSLFEIILLIIFWVLPVIFNFHVLIKTRFWKKEEIANNIGIGIAVAYALLGIPGLGMAWDALKNSKGGFGGNRKASV